MSNIVQDLCDRYHTFFYLQGDRKPCPYCQLEGVTSLYNASVKKVESLTAELDALQSDKNEG